MKRMLLALFIAILGMILLWKLGISSSGSLGEHAEALQQASADSNPMAAPSNVPELARSPAILEPQITTKATRIKVQGTILFSDHEGRHLISHRGYISWEVNGDSPPNPIQSAIHDDKWELMASPGAVLRPIQAIWSGDGASQNSTVEDVTIPTVEGLGITLHASLAYGTTLSVIDATTRAHLRKAEVIFERPEAISFRDTPYPPKCFEDRGPSLEGPSPILLPNMPGTLAAWIGAPGYAWTRFAFRGTPGELVVALSRGSDLKIVVTGIPTNCPIPIVQVYRSRPVADMSNVTAVPLAERFVREGVPVQLTGLPVGDLLVVVAACEGAPFAGPRLGELVINLQASEERVAVLNLMEPRFGSMYGAIDVRIVAGGRGEKLSNMSRVLIEQSQFRGHPVSEDYFASKSPSKDGIYRSICTKLLPGTYIVSLHPWGLTQAVEVVAGQNTKVEFLEPDLSDVSISLVHAGSTKPIHDADLRMRPSLCNSPNAWTEAKADRNGLFRLRCARGTQTVFVAVPGHQVVTQELQIKETVESFVIAMPPDQKYVIRFRALQGNTPALLPELFWMNIEVASTDQAAGHQIGIRTNVQQVGLLTATDASEADIFVDKLGDYTVRFPEVFGIRRVEPITVRVLGAESPEWPLTIEYEASDSY